MISWSNQPEGVMLGRILDERYNLLARLMKE